MLKFDLTIIYTVAEILHLQRNITVFTLKFSVSFRLFGRERFGSTWQYTCNIFLFLLCVTILNAQHYRGCPLNL